jgi:DNA-binding MarR family transcriptional regulator
VKSSFGSYSIHLDAQGNHIRVARKSISAHDLDQNLGLLIQELSLLMRKHFNRNVRGLGLTAPQWQVLAELYREQGITQTELADALVMAKSPLGKLLDKLERSGLIERRRDKLDRRANRIHLTRRMARAMERADQASQATVGIATRGMSAAQRTELRKTLRQAKDNMLDAVRAQYDAADPQRTPRNS